jgi:D-apionolactonase
MAQKKPSRAIKLFGTEAPDGKRRELRAGPISAVFDSGALRYIRYHGEEVLRGIAYLVRDKDWGTYAPAIENLKIRQNKHGFAIAYQATCRDQDQAIHYSARIGATGDGTLKFSAEATPLSDFLTNRTGFVVLHPLAGTVGRPVKVVHTDGKNEKRKFPKFISPGQPIFEIRSLEHETLSGVAATVLMEGNKFEMEDHRNWMDASYKTYVCSLLDPWPYTLEKGKSFSQSITLTVSGKPPKSRPRTSAAGTTITLAGTKGRIPQIGLGVPMAEAAAALEAVDLIAAAKPQALVCQIDGRERGQEEAAASYRELSRQTGIPVTLEIILPAREPANKELAAIASAVNAAELAPASIVVTQMHDLKSFQPNTPRPWGPTYEEMATAARASFPNAILGGGMLSYFTELNRKPVPKGVFDFITHTGCPIVHAPDNISVMETLETLPWIFASARAMIGKVPYHIGPTSIPCRDNPYGAAVTPNPDNRRVCLSDIDPRQRGLFAAAWNLGYLSAAARAGVDAVALGSATGPQGMIYRKLAHAQPWFDGADARILPIYHVIAGLAAAGGARRIDTDSSAPSKLAALAHRNKAGEVLWLANLSGETQRLKVNGFEGPARLDVLDERSFEAAVRDPAWLDNGSTFIRKVGSFELPSYGVARIKSG